MATDDTPSQPDTPIAHDSELAADIIRQKISGLYVSDAQTKTEPNLKQEEQEVSRVDHRSEHQQFIYNLSHSGKSLADVQTAWHNYYLALPDDQKHQVWQEFYNNQATIKKTQAAPAKPEPKPAHKPTNRTVGNIKKQITKSVSSKGALKAKHHFQSILFGLGIGSFAVLVLLFGFFNERIVAPFITPSKTVSNTPIISASGEVASTASEVIIPKINVQIPVIYDQTSIDEEAIQTSLESGVVHYATTSSPGEQGNTVIFGHSSNNILNKGKYKFAFVLLNRLQVGDTFTLTKGGKRYVYQIYDRKIVKPTDISVLGPAAKPSTATLITCDPPGTSLNRLVVTGEQISPSPAANVASSAIKAEGQPSVVPSDAPSLWHRIIGIFS